MAVYLTCEIAIGNSIKFNFCEDLEIVSTWQQLTDTATLTLPRNLKLQEGISKYLKSGDFVDVYLGYNGELTSEFRGYVRRIGSDLPITIECEDFAFSLKKENHKLSWESVSLKKLINSIVPADMNTEVIDFELSGGYRINAVNTAKVLEAIREQYGFVSYFDRDGKLVVGFPYGKTGNEVNYHFQKNVPMEGNNLEFRTEDDLKIKVEAVSIMSDNTKITTSVGEEGGDSTTLHFYNISSETELKKLATEKLQLLKVSGFKGSFRTFGTPTVRHGDIANIIDDDYPERNGRYFVDKVVTMFGNNGFFRDVYLGKKA